MRRWVAWSPSAKEATYAGENPFSEILGVLELYGWKLQRIATPYRIFTKGRELPIVIPVHDRMVDTIYAEKIEKILKANLESDEQGG